MAAPALARAAAPAPAPSRPQPSRSRPGRRAPARPARSRPAAPRRLQPAVSGAALLPHAAVRTAGAVRDLSDSSLIVRLTQGRIWIGVLGALLAGIVALNVVILGLNAGSGQVTQRIDRLERENSALRAEVAQRLSSGRVEAAAARLGMAVPEPREISYLQARGGDAKRAAKALGPAGP
jgi:cell division protein FtsL